ncbi:hypothetical protein [Uliginosibacterium sp. 31-12]|uniref:hypothetical protein n=1 Tax=Uliginosibacterium sp. 31-12 TaxID=3062781 RepID=UPI0026E36583|nr:hypothetical protein [Uliginosibacterium sp. 31-12]MDO6385812.1 hypothetical protein [Uliginosibacterium sp. 31-12]
MQNMTVLPLVDAIFAITSAPENAVICTREPFSWGAESVIAQYTEDFRVPKDVQLKGFKYFLGKEDVVDLLDKIAAKRASRETQAEFVAHYAMFDAYPYWFDDLQER